MGIPLRVLAEFFDLPEAYLAKHLQRLSGAGLVSARRGPGGGYALAREPQDITLVDLVRAVEGEARAFRCTELRQRGPSGVAAPCYRGACGIARAMWRAEWAWAASLAGVTLAELAATGAAETPPEQMRKAALWFRDWMMGQGK
jgi:Rrf2 family protein